MWLSMEHVKVAVARHGAVIGKNVMHGAASCAHKIAPLYSGFPQHWMGTSIITDNHM